MCVYPLVSSRPSEGEFTLIFDRLRNYTDKFFCLFCMHVFAFNELLSTHSEIKHSKMNKKYVERYFSSWKISCDVMVSILISYLIIRMYREIYPMIFTVQL